jgi:hypothetical protein
VATGGSLLAVSALGQSMNPASGEQVSVKTVNRALDKEPERTPTVPRRFISPRPSPAARPSSAAGHSAPPPSPGTPGGTVLTSQGGTVVASCAGAYAYLASWSPQQGFASSNVVRGPATNAQVTFTGGQVTVTMVVSCDAGVPNATATAVNTWGGDGD